MRCSSRSSIDTVLSQFLFVMHDLEALKITYLYCALNYIMSPLPCPVLPFLTLTRYPQRHTAVPAIFAGVWAFQHVGTFGQYFVIFGLIAEFSRVPCTIIVAYFECRIGPAQL